MRSTLAAGAWILVILSGGVVEAAVRYLDDGTIKIGIDLNKGGSITYFARFGQQYAGTNVVNSHDLGREIQQSYYCGPYPYSPPGVPKNPNCTDFCWNAVQAGDSYGNASQVLNWSTAGSELYVKTRPMQWA